MRAAEGRGYVLGSDDVFWNKGGGRAGSFWGAATIFGTTHGTNAPSSVCNTDYSCMRTGVVCVADGGGCVVQVCVLCSLDLLSMVIIVYAFCMEPASSCSRSMAIAMVSDT